MDGFSSELIVLVVALIGAGALVGFMAGLLGVGGGAIMVPILFQLFTFLNVPEEFRMHLAVGTSFGVMIPTSLQSFRKHLAKHAVDVPLLKRWALSIIGGVIVGWAVARYAPSETLRGVFAVVALLLALKMLLGRDEWRIGDEMPKMPTLDVLGWIVGLLSSLMGIGGGVFGTTIMTLYNKPIHKAVATSSGIGVLIALPGMLGYMLIGLDKMKQLPIFSLGYVNLLAVALIIPLSLWAAPIGVRLAHRLKKRTLERVFAVFLLLVSARFFATLV